MIGIVARTESIDDCEDDYEDDCLPVIVFSYGVSHYRDATRGGAFHGPRLVLWLFHVSHLGRRNTGAQVSSCLTMLVSML